MTAANQQLNTDSEKLEHFVSAVNSEIEKTIDVIISEADATKKEILDEAKDQSLNAAYERIQDSIKKVSSKYTKLVSKAELDCKKDILILREKLTEKVFENIRQSLAEFRKKPQYLKYLISLVKAEKLNDNAVILLSAADMEYSSDIKKALELSCEFKEDMSIKFGGLSILYPEQGILIDKTIDLALIEQRDDFNEKNCFSKS